MKRALLLLGALALLAGGIAVAALATPPAGGPPGQGECEHGNSGSSCKPDPQPDHGQDCDEHGNHGGVNEDHCLPDETTPTDTTPTDTTPTDTTPTDTTPTTPTTTTPTETTPTTEAPPAVTPPVVDPPATVAPTPSVTVKPTVPVRKATAKKKVVKVKVVKEHKAPVLTGDPKVDKCKDLKNGTMNCKGVVVTPGQG